VRRAAATGRARALRRDDTAAEARLWSALRDRRLGGWKWRRQVPKGPFIVDFYCAQASLVVELDGGGHSETLEHDARRTASLAALGLRVIRFWNHQVRESLDGVCLSILNACEASGADPLTQPSPRGGEGS
jgi:very-short-patch-repair endonuclease